MSSKELRVSMLQVNALVHEVNSFPEKMPKRWSLISQLVSMVEECTETTAYIDLASNVQTTKGTGNVIIILIQLPCTILLFVLVLLWPNCTSLTGQPLRGGGLARETITRHESNLW